MNLALVFLVSKAQGDFLEAPELDLLKRANGWLRRKQAGVHDSLLLVGDNFQSEEEFKDFLRMVGQAAVAAMSSSALAAAATATSTAVDYAATTTTAVDYAAAAPTAVTASRCKPRYDAA